MREAFALANDDTQGERRFGPCAYQLGYRGHCLTKSRRYSTTFMALREARERHVHDQLLARSTDAVQRAIAGASERVGHFRYAGQGHITTGDRLLATAAAARAREHRRLAREELGWAPARTIAKDSAGAADQVCPAVGGLREDAA